MGRRTAAVVALAGMVLVTSGCESGTNGTATPSTTTDISAATAALWDPCTQVSDQQLQRIGVVPSTRRSGIAGVEEPGWKVCSWHDAASQWNYSLGVWSTIYSIDDLRKKPENVDFVGINVGGRDGFRFRNTSDVSGEDCDLAFPAGQGALQVTVFNASPKSSVAPCDRAVSAAEVLVPTFPR
ncbi:DUF3558 domain-containing protein [Nocardia gipuzkoensis]|uniref:DUF3558 domain-containing protein n=1 Tax=Nocardia gipuzkoensis TaxID=2749991 RepID=UPI00237E1E2F|nr:DUF3558 domain-containing protein [Nocardia gipuzkoensis]MDE1669124.1 DUF3558 domain-containing protein [Nocardia gipuzkoensis]